MTKGILYQIISVVRTPAGISAVIELPGSEERETLLLSGEFWTPLGLSRGDTIEEDTLSELRRAELLSRAVSRCVKILAGSDHSRSQLLRKLKMFGFEEEIASLAADYAEEHGYIDEERQALSAAESFVRHKYWGRKRIAAELLMRGYKKTAILYAADHISDEAYMTALHVLLDRKYKIAMEKEDRDRLFASLYRQGFSLSEINAAVKELENEE